MSLRINLTGIRPGYVFQEHQMGQVARLVQSRMAGLTCGLTQSGGSLSVDIPGTLSVPWLSIPEIVAVPAGSFIMGRKGLRNNPNREVTIADGFGMGLHKVTNENYRDYLVATERDTWICC